MSDTGVGLLVWLLKRLPERYVEVLWLTEIGNRTAQEVADILGTEPEAASLLVHHAREGVRQAYLREQSGPRPAASECAAVHRSLPAHVRGAASVRATERVEAHLGRCRGCRERSAELQRTAQLIPVASALLELASGEDGAFLKPLMGTATGVGVVLGPLRFGAAAGR